MLFHLNDEFDLMTNKNGVYQWIYHPDFDPNTISGSDLEDRLKEYTEKDLSYGEEFSGKYKFQGTIFEQRYKHNGNIFGLSKVKHDELLNHLTNKSALSEFQVLFKELCYSKPFYVGKANNLKLRLKSHFDRRGSDVLNKIDSYGIPYTDIWIGYRIIDDPKNLGLNVIIEEVFSRIFKPGLTKKPN